MIRTLIIILLASLLIGCATPSSQEQREQYIHLYKQQPAHKALAYAAFPDGGFVFGPAVDMPDVESARQKALSLCNENAFKLGYPARCKIIYENNEFVAR